MNRRKFNQSLLAFLGTSPISAKLYAQNDKMPTRTIHSSGETLPLVGFGSSKLVSLIQQLGPERMIEVLGALKSHGGSVVDTWPRNPANDEVFGNVINQDEFRESLFITTKIDRMGKANGEEQFEEALRLYKRSSVDLAQVFSLTDVYAHWETLTRLKEEGKARYIGVTVSQYELYDDLLNFLSDHQPDFIQVNYSITERLAEDRIIPYAYDRGISIIVNRPFMNGQYFQALEEVPLPVWAEEFNCHTWAEFSLKYIFSNPMITCVLTETSNPIHMLENAKAALGPFPDNRHQGLMTQFIDTI